MGVPRRRPRAMPISTARVRLRAKGPRAVWVLLLTDDPGAALSLEGFT